jgi:5-formyltetrahydrofolate cyclo-ligase
MSKESAREHGYAVRQGMTMHEQALLDARIFHHVQDGWDWSAINRVHIYLPLAQRREIGTWAIVRWLWAAWPSVEVYVPRLTSSGMDHVLLAHDSRLRPNHYHIPEPMAGRLLAPTERLDLVIAPLLAYDRQGHRVGYGAGYYDRFLSEHLEAERIGLAYAACLIQPGIVTERHDVSLQVIVTELGREPLTA